MKPNWIRVVYEDGVLWLDGVRILKASQHRFVKEFNWTENVKGYIWQTKDKIEFYTDAEMKKLAGEE